MTKNENKGVNRVKSANQNPAENGTATEEDGHKRNLTVWKTACFILGDVAGSGILVLPKILSETGWFGVFLLAICCAATLYSSLLLSRCWLILEEKFEECREPNRFPYALIAQKAFGKKMRLFVSIVIDVSCFGAATVFLVLSSELLSSATEGHVSFCTWVFIFAGLLCTVLWFGTPKDFWLVGILAMLCTFLASAILFIMLVLEISPSTAASYPGPSFSSFFLAFASLMYAFGGIVTFPTFQNDMKNREKFPIAATISFLVLFLLYLSIAAMGYFVYGDSVKSSFTQSLPENTARTVAELLFALHMFFAFPIVLNTGLQDAEAYLGVPRSFGWKRVLFRTGVLACSVLIAESIPNFRKVLNVVGSVFGGMTGMVFPCLFYYKLCSMWDLWKNSKYQMLEKIVIIIIVISGTVGTVISTYQAIADIIIDNYCPPCFQNFSSKCN